MKPTTVKLTDNSVTNVIIGCDALNVTAGTFLKVLKGSPSNVGDLILRTSSDRQPFIGIKYEKDVPQDGNFWGCSIEDYKFEAIKNIEIIIS